MAWLIVFVVLAAGVAAVLFVPMHVHVEVDTAPESAAWLRWRVRWLMLGFGRPSAEDQARTPRRERKSKKPRRKGPGRGRQVRAVLSTPGFLRRVRRLFGQVASALRPASLEAAVRIGLDDPASTGVLYGRLMALAAGFPSSWRLRFEPDFEELVVACRARADWSVPLAAVLWPLLTFAVAPVVWRAARSAWRVRPARAL